MKKIKYIIVLSICAFITFTSCKKENDNAPNNSNENSITQKLINFKGKLESKDGSTLSLDSSMWYLEGLLNYENANNDHAMGDIDIYSDSIIINVNGTQISTSELFAVYQKLNNTLEKINKSENNLLIFNMIDLAIKPSNVTNEQKITLTISAGKESKSWIITQFNAGDAWVFGYGGGSCTTDPNNPNYGNHTSDAAEQMQYRINNSLRPIQTGGYFVNITSTLVVNGQYDPNYPGRWEPYTKFSVYRTGSYTPDFGICLNQIELNYYMSKFEQIAYNSIPSGKTFFNVDIYGDRAAYCGLPQSYWYITHVYKIFYGDVVVNHSSPPNSTN